MDEDEYREDRVSKRYSVSDYVDSEEEEPE
jgi:hypothetical protein